MFKPKNMDKLNYSNLLAFRTKPLVKPLVRLFHMKHMLCQQINLHILPTRLPPKKIIKLYNKFLSLLLSWYCYPTSQSTDRQTSLTMADNIGSQTPPHIALFPSAGMGHLTPSSSLLPCYCPTTIWSPCSQPNQQCLIQNPLTHPSSFPPIHKPRISSTKSFTQTSNTPIPPLMTLSFSNLQPSANMSIFSIL